MRNYYSCWLENDLELAAGWVLEILGFCWDQQNQLDLLKLSVEDSDNNWALCSQPGPWRWEESFDWQQTGLFLCCRSHVKQVLPTKVQFLFCSTKGHGLEKGGLTSNILKTNFIPRHCGQLNTFVKCSFFISSNTISSSKFSVAHLETWASISKAKANNHLVDQHSRFSRFLSVTLFPTEQ